MLPRSRVPWLTDVLLYFYMIPVQEHCIAEFCAGMATGTIVACAVAKTAKEEVGSALCFHTAFYSEMDARKRQIIERVHKQCHSDRSVPLIVPTTGDIAQSIRRGESGYHCKIAIKAIECDDISQCSTSQKSVTLVGLI